jgi:hypothetical protein
MTSKEENELLLHHNVLFAPQLAANDVLLTQFCGIVVRSIAELNAFLNGERAVFLTGDSSNIAQIVASNRGNGVMFFIVRGLVNDVSEESVPIAASDNVRVVDEGMVPINVHNVGVLFRGFFSAMPNVFARVTSAHQLQALTESDKPGVALRTGIYLTDVERRAEDADALHFRLLRCSSNLQGPTDNFAAVDRDILARTNEIVPFFFAQPTAVNHVLAQVYHNKRNESANKEAKATIKRHSDKTKDMPTGGIIAFATFYDFSHLEPGAQSASATDRFDLCYRGKSSVLTQMEFALKDPATHAQLDQQFRVKLYPDSLLIISLGVNRLFTHETKPSVLPVERMPVRLGYVMRCSKTKAVFRDGHTHIVDENDAELPLQPMTSSDAVAIKELYRVENMTDERVVYPLFTTSFNSGDFMAPTGEGRSD